MGKTGAFKILACAATALVATAIAPSASASDACPADGKSGLAWIGMSQLHGGKGYVDTPMGQVHYRLIGDGDGPVLLLLHQTPWSMVEYIRVQPCLAERGIRALAVDTPGYGMSDAPDGRPSIDAYADNLIPVLDALGIKRVIVAGHHTGAAIAVSFAARHADRVRGLLLHGTPLYSATERATRLASLPRERTLKADGSHLSDYYRYIREYAGHDPRTMVTANWSVITWYLAGVADVLHEAVFKNDLDAELKTVKAPLLILSDAKDSLHQNDLRAARVKSWFRYRQFSEGGAHALMIEPSRWASIAADFVHGVTAGRAPTGPKR